jgi:hypothetical protein
MKTPPRFAIVNTIDSPTQSNIAEWVPGTGYCYMRRGTSPRFKQYDGMTPRRPTAIEDFGFDVFVGKTEAAFVLRRKSVATYEDGVPRVWQGDDFESAPFFLPLVKLRSRSRKAPK